MEKQLKKQLMILYGVFLCIIFISAPYMGIVSNVWTYNMTCPDGSIELFNESTLEVCGKQNPLNTETKEDYKYKDINYLDSFNLT